MKRYADLTPTQQQNAKQSCFNDYLQQIIEGELRFNDELYGDDLQSRIDSAFDKANEMQTPWFANEYLCDDPVIIQAIGGLAASHAENAIYLEADEYAIRLA